MNEQYTSESNKEAIEKIYTSVLSDLGLDQYAQISGYFREESNTRARTYGNRIYINENFLETDFTEQQRVAYHESQHILNSKSYVESDSYHAKALFAFVLHPIFSDLHDRMEKHYIHYVEDGYKFGKKISPLASKYTDLGLPNESYTHPDEVLALLRGYWCYLQQIGQGDKTKIEPYEFIEAFKKEDLELLDETYRLRLAEEVVKADPDALKVAETTPLVFKKKE